MKLAGKLTFKIDGKIYWAIGNFTYGLGSQKRSPIVTHNGIAGFSSENTEPFIEGTIVKRDVMLGNLAEIEDATILLELPDGGTFTLYNSFAIFDKGVEADTEKAEIKIRFVGKRSSES